MEAWELMLLVAWILSIVGALAISSFLWKILLVMIFIIPVSWGEMKKKEEGK